MFQTPHSKFIFSPISKVLKDAVSASSGIGAGIETYPLCDYVMQSIFIKMTGFQEQKMKCICWDIASIDLEYRYEFTKKPLGECSNYEDKNDIYKNVLKILKKYEILVDDVFEKRLDLIDGAIREVVSVFNGTNLSIWAQAAFFDFKKIVKSLKPNFIASDKNIFNDGDLRVWYSNHLYKNRNRVAHNTSSYQQNLPTLKTLANENYKFENYFLFFFMLILIDEIVSSLCKRFFHEKAERAE